MLKDLESKVRECDDQKESAEILVKGVADALDELTQDPVAIGRMATNLRESAANLGEAITANTDSDSKKSGDASKRVKK